MNSIQRASALFDNFPESAKNMPKAEFVKRVCELTSQQKMQQDLRVIINHKQEMRTRQLLVDAQKKKIDEAIK